MASIGKATQSVALPWDLGGQKVLTLLQSSSQGEEPIKVRIPRSVDLDHREEVLKQFPALETFVRENFIRVIPRAGTSLADVRVTPHGRVRVSWLATAQGSKVYIAEIGHRSILEVDSSFCEGEKCEVWFGWAPKGYLASIILEHDRYMGHAELVKQKGQWTVSRADFDSPPESPVTE